MIIIACNKHFIAWIARAYDMISLTQKISITRLFHSLVRDIFFVRENVSYGLTNHAMIYTSVTESLRMFGGESFRTSFYSAGIPKMAAGIFLTPIGKVL